MRQMQTKSGCSYGLLGDWHDIRAYCAGSRRHNGVTIRRAGIGPLLRQGVYAVEYKGSIVSLSVG